MGVRTDNSYRPFSQMKMIKKGFGYALGYSSIFAHTPSGESPHWVYTDAPPGTKDEFCMRSSGAWWFAFIGVVGLSPKTLRENSVR